MFYLKISLYFSTGNGQPRDQHCANCIGTLSFPTIRSFCDVYSCNFSQHAQSKRRSSGFIVYCTLPGSRDIRQGGATVRYSGDCMYNVIAEDTRYLTVIDRVSRKLFKTNCMVRPTAAVCPHLLHFDLPSVAVTVNSATMQTRVGILCKLQ